MLNLYVNRWTLSLIIAVIGLILYFAGYETLASVCTPIAISFVCIGGARRSDMTLTMSFLAGVAVGIACIWWIYSVCAILLLVVYQFMILKVNSFKPLWSLIFGVLTPFWVYLPFYLYFNHETIVDAILKIDFTTLI